jgi:uncharacterized OB-fold protein
MNTTLKPSEAKYPAEFRQFWNGLREGKISFPQCTECGHTHWYPMKLCPHCLGGDFAWHSVSGTGTLYSWTVVRRAFSAEQAGSVPYVVGLVAFEEVPGTRLITNIIGCDIEELTIDMVVEPVFSDDATAPPTVRFRPARGK